MKYSVAKQDSVYYIVATVKSDRMRFLKEANMLIKTSDGEVIKLIGTNIGDGSESVGINCGNIIIPYTYIISTAQFAIAEEQLQKLQQGVIKIRITTMPMYHEREFKKDKIGKKLYKYYKELKEKEQNDEF